MLVPNSECERRASILNQSCARMCTHAARNTMVSHVPLCSIHTSCFCCRVPPSFVEKPRTLDRQISNLEKQLCSFLGANVRPFVPRPPSHVCFPHLKFLVPTSHSITILIGLRVKYCYMDVRCLMSLPSYTHIRHHQHVGGYALAHKPFVFSVADGEVLQKQIGFRCICVWSHTVSNMLPSVASSVGDFLLCIECNFE